MAVTLMSDLDGDTLQLDLLRYDDDRPVTYASKAIEQGPGEFTPGGSLRTITTHREQGAISLSLTLQIPHHRIDDVLRWLQARRNATATVVVPRRAAYESMMIGALTQIGEPADQLQCRLALREIRIVQSRSVLFSPTEPNDTRADAKAAQSEADEDVIDAGRVPLTPDQVTQGNAAAYSVTPAGWLDL